MTLRHTVHRYEYGAEAVLDGSLYAFRVVPKKSRCGRSCARTFQLHVPTSWNSPLAAMSARERAQFRIFRSNGSFFTLSGVR
jgi:hypothetical protein